MRSFLQRRQSEIKGVLNGFDRLRFRGTIRWLASLQGMLTFMSTIRLLHKDFTGWAKGIGFEQRDNCFVDVSNVRQAQALLTRQLRTNWSAVLNRLLKQCHPAHATLLDDRPLDYYWSADETEWATDVMFQSREQLARLYPRLVRHALTTFGSKDVLRFLGQAPVIRRDSKAEITSSLVTRPEGMRVKHARNRNSLKIYDKQETVLRVETTINNPRELKVWRPKEGDPQGPKQRL